MDRAPPPILDFEELPGAYAICRLPPDMPVPDVSAFNGFVSVSRAADETSLVCPLQHAPPGAEIETGWSALKVSTLAELDQPGVVRDAVTPISDHGLGVFVVSTFLRDYLLVRTDTRGIAQIQLLKAGHRLALSPSGLVLRHVNADDADAAAAFHARLARETYGQIAPAAFMGAEGHQRRIDHWRDRLANPATGQVTLFLMRGEEIVGLLDYGPASDAAFGDAGEVKRLYLDRSCARQGVGTKLMQLAYDGIMDAGFPAMALGVVRENGPARAFYQALGGVETGSYIDAGPTWPSDNVVMTWAARPERAKETV